MMLIRTTSDLADVCARLATHPFVAIDTEFMRERTYYSELCLVQLASPGIEAIVDPLAPDIALDPLWALLFDPKVTKVFHAGRQDIEIVVNKTGRIPTPVFDTQVAAMVCGFGDSISYVNLVRELTGVTLDKSSRFSDWARRPLAKAQLEYAAADVTHLRTVYTSLAAELAAGGRREWVAEEMRDLVDPSTYDQSPAEAWRRLKARVKGRKAIAVLRALAEWREVAAQEKNVPRQRIVKDEQLYDIAAQAPVTIDALGELRSLPQGFARSGRGGEIVAAVKKGLTSDLRAIEVPAIPLPLTAAATATAELLKVLLKACAARHKVAARLVASTEDIDRMASDDQPDVPALSGWRRDVFGEDALRLKRGEVALGLVAGEVTVVEQTPGPSVASALG